MALAFWKGDPGEGNKQGGWRLQQKEISDHLDDWRYVNLHTGSHKL